MNGFSTGGKGGMESQGSWPGTAQAISDFAYDNAAFALGATVEATLSGNPQGLGYGRSGVLAFDLGMRAADGNGFTTHDALAVTGG